MADAAVFILTLLVVSKGIHLSSRNPTTNTQLLEFKVPLVPWIPILALFANISMMLHLSRITWYRFAVWFGIGKFLKEFVHFWLKMPRIHLS